MLSEASHSGVRVSRTKSEELLSSSALTRFLFFCKKITLLNFFTLINRVYNRPNYIFSDVNIKENCYLKAIYYFHVYSGGESQVTSGNWSWLTPDTFDKQTILPAKTHITKIPGCCGYCAPQPTVIPLRTGKKGETDAGASKTNQDVH